MKKRPELLSPAGTMEKMRFAFHYGADAVYLAGKQFGMRAASGNFTEQELIDACRDAHAMGKRVYVAVNIMPHPADERGLAAYLSFLGREARPDALIVADLGVLLLAREYAPGLPLHISTQANVASVCSCRMWQELGAKRVVLARELTFEEIREIRDQVPAALELEVFVHGSMCMAVSGRCLLSSFFTGRDANRGACAQPCRWEYFAEDMPQAGVELTERERPGQPFRVQEDRRGTYLFSAKDLCMIEHIPDLFACGVDSIKIEGRMKSAYYAAVTANAYRTALDQYAEQGDAYVFDGRLLEELESVSHRAYGTGFFYARPQDSAQISYEGGYRREKAFLAVVEGYDPETRRAALVQRNKMVEGAWAELVSPGRPSLRFCVQDMRDQDGTPVFSTPHPSMRFSIRMPFAVQRGDLIRSADGPAQDAAFE